MNANMPIDKIRGGDFVRQGLVERGNRMNKDEASLLLFFESCFVETGGLVDTSHMNDDDHAIAERWTASGFVTFGRLPAKYAFRKGSKSTHRVTISADAWKEAHAQREERAARCSVRLDKRIDETESLGAQMANEDENKVEV
jgi:hypothetical protein